MNSQPPQPDDKVQRWSPPPGDTSEDPTKETPKDPATNGTQKSTIIVVDSEQKWDIGTQTALWAAISDLGFFNMEKTSDPNSAVALIQKGTEQKIIAVLVLGTQNTLLSAEIQAVIRASTKSQIKIILLPTDTPQDSKVEAFKYELKSPRPTIIQAHAVTAALLGSIREEIKAVISSSTQTPPK